MAPRFRSRSFSGSLVCVALLCWQGSASAQLPDKFTNLKVLPKTIAKDELVSVMRQFSVGLGVRCNFCHAEADSTKGKGLDFASDARNEKKVARTMMTMAETIFRPFYLNAVAEWLAHERKDADGAISILNVSVYQDPREADTFNLLGMIQSMKGDKPEAIESYEHALELDPENHRTQDLLKALQSEK